MLSENYSALLSLPNEIISHIISDVIISNEIEIFDPCTGAVADGDKRKLDPVKETRLVCKAFDDHYKAVRNTQKFRHMNYIRSSGFFDPETTVWTADFSTIWANIQNSHDTSFSRAASNATFQQCARILQLDMSIGPSSFGHKLQTHRLCLEFWARVIRNVGNLSCIDLLSDALGRCNADGSGLREVAGNIKETTEDLAEEPENPHCYSEEEDESDVEDVILEV
ncbi:uncharacterized protein RSE6_02902 [Rhynchosporium secalis]|uniref:Uncharacterized protein n=1 Tax=Rhynchosporium secalis TaxID=38038 RepID=A0A1E1M2X7_RHYSE|nr:uncharacterized protein RSE6_02902 [Rhynchosporium secalis]